MTQDPTRGTPAVPGQPSPRLLHERGRLPWSLKLAVVVIYPVASLLFRLRYRNGERMPRTGPVLLVANHVSVLDPLACARLVYDHGRVPHFLAKEAVFRGLAGVILRDAGQIPVARGSSEARGALAAAAADLEAGNVVVIYPEGSVTRDGDWWPMQARTGVARLALTTAARARLPHEEAAPAAAHAHRVLRRRAGRPHRPARRGARGTAAHPRPAARGDRHHHGPGA